VSDVSLLATKIITVPGEEVTLPNSVVLGGSVINYTRLSQGRGPLVTTTATIGYDAPWRLVESLLLGAASETTGIRKEPGPFVLQRSLSDFYVEYQLVARIEGDPTDRPRILSELHARIQDAFNEAGVQIMSPHFVLQPDKPVVVPRDQWEGQPPAKPRRG
jgi:small-conductance mechanosensitive channel